MEHGLAPERSTRASRTFPLTTSYRPTVRLPWRNSDWPALKVRSTRAARTAAGSQSGSLTDQFLAENEIVSTKQ